MKRNDISDYLIHFTKGSSWQEAYEILKLIVDQQMLIGSNNLIKGSHTCVCF